MLPVDMIVLERRKMHQYHTVGKILKRKVCDKGKKLSMERWGTGWDSSLKASRFNQLISNIEK